MDTLLPANYAQRRRSTACCPRTTPWPARSSPRSRRAGKPIPVVTGQDSEVESVKSIMAGEQYSTINKDTRNLVKRDHHHGQGPPGGQDAEVNDTKSYNNGVKVVPAVPARRRSS